MAEGAFESFNDEREMAARWQKLRKSGTMDSLRKGVPAMVIKYTEEQLNSVDKSMLIHMFLNQQEQLERASSMEVRFWRLLL